jgi:hypothetical protein
VSEFSDDQELKEGRAFENHWPPHDTSVKFTYFHPEKSLMG